MNPFATGKKGAPPALPKVPKKTGRLPADLRALESAWYMGDASKEEILAAAKALAQTGPIGGFLVRIPDSNPASYALAVKTKENAKPQNFLIKCSDGMFTLGTSSSQSLSGLIDILSTTATKLPVKSVFFLLLPCACCGRACGHTERQRQTETDRQKDRQRDTHTHTHTYTHTHTHTHAHTHTRTHTHMYMIPPHLQAAPGLCPDGTGPITAAEAKESAKEEEERPPQSTRVSRGERR